MVHWLRTAVRFLLGLLWVAFIVLAVLVLAALRWSWALIGSKKGLVALGGLAMLGGIVLAVWFTLQATGATRLPEQPLAFPHSVHAGDLQISCLFCHRGAASDAVAGLPSVEQCMSCHRVVGRGKPGVDRLVAAWEAGEPLNWLRLSRLPDHTRFDHEVHFRAGVTCSVCHGEVAAMKEMRRVRSLEMGDCLACHRQQGAPYNCSVCHY